MILTAEMTPTHRTLQASRDEWEAAARRIARQDRALAGLILREIKGHEGEPAVRLTFSEELARRILQLAGVSA